MRRSSRCDPPEASAVAPPAQATPWWQFAQAALLARLLAKRDDGPAEDLEVADDAAAMALQAFAEEVSAGEGTFGQLAAACDLDDVDVAVLAVLVACEFDADCSALASALGGTANGHTTFALVQEVLGVQGLDALAPGAPLDRAGLVEVADAGRLLDAAVAVPRPVSWRVLDAPPNAGELQDARLLRAPLEVGMTLGAATRVLVSGADRVRRYQAALRHAAALVAWVAPPPSTHDGWRALTRRAGLDGAAVVLDLDGQPGADVRFWIERCDHLVWVLCSRDPIDLAALDEGPWVDVTAEPPEVTTDEWSAVFPTEPAPARRSTAAQLEAARSLAPQSLSAADVVRRVSSGTLLKHATRVVPRVGWDELVLPDGLLVRLHSLVDRYRYRSIVHNEWDLPLFPSPGVVALFSGPSGTGKTTTVEVIAHELGVDMFRVDLSALVSKYIGETEKNLEEIFSAAHAGDYVLLFDEADSLFGARSKVEDARDRYANMEVSYLLQRLETYDGFVVLTSNFQGNIDPAFLRRIHVTVHFAVPSVDDRARIWSKSFAGAPLEDVDLRFVAEKFDLTGGSIRNAALTAAFRAAAGGGTVTMIDVLHAVGQEMTKLGRRPTDDQFGRWLPEMAESKLR